MINEVMINRLDELIGDYNTPFFNYLLYSYDLSLNECESIIDELKEDISSSKVVSDNMVSTLDAYFKSKVADLEKQEKLKYLKKYDLPADDISLIRERVESKIIADNITDFEIKRYLEYYFSNSLKQISYINDLNGIVGNNYDTLLIQNQKKTYPILRDRDIVDIVFAIHGEIIEAREFKNGIKNEFKRQCMIRSEDKKAKCRKNLNRFVVDSGDSFSKLVEFKGLEKRDGEIIVSQIMDDISKGLVQPEMIDGVFITRRFNDYNERQ